MKQNGEHFEPGDHVIWADTRANGKLALRLMRVRSVSNHTYDLVEPRNSGSVIHTVDQHDCHELVDMGEAPTLEKPAAPPFQQVIDTLLELAQADNQQAQSGSHNATSRYLMHASALTYAAARLEEVMTRRGNAERAAAARLVPVRKVTKQEALTDTRRLDWLGLRPREFQSDYETGEWSVGQMEGSRNDMEFNWLAQMEHATIRDAIDAAMLKDGALKNEG